MCICFNTAMWNVWHLAFWVNSCNPFQAEQHGTHQSTKRFLFKQSSAASSLPLFLVACDMRKMPSLAAMIPTVL